MTRWYVWTCTALTAAAIGCADDSTVVSHHDGTADSISDIGPAPLPDAAESPDSVAPSEPLAFPSTWEIVMDPLAPPGVVAAAEDLRQALMSYWGFDAVVISDESAVDKIDCASFTGRIIFAGEGVSQPKFEVDNVTVNTWTVSEKRCLQGTAFTLSGGGAFGRQVAAYRVLELLGVRFLHPLETAVPSTPWWPDALRDAHGDGRVQWRLFDGTASVMWQLANGVTAFFGDDPDIVARELPRAIRWSAIDTSGLAQALDAGDYRLVVLDTPKAAAATQLELESVLNNAVDLVRDASPGVEIVVRVNTAARTSDGYPHFEAVAAVPSDVGVQLLFEEGVRFRDSLEDGLLAFFDAQVGYRSFHYALAVGMSPSLDAPLGLVGELGLRLDDLRMLQPWAETGTGGWSGIQIVPSGLEWWRWATSVGMLRAGADGGLNLSDHILHLTHAWGSQAQAAVTQVATEAAYMVAQEYIADGAWALLTPPLVLTPKAVPSWTPTALNSWLTGYEPQLVRLIAAKERWLSTLDGVASTVPEEAMAWFGEFYDAVSASHGWTTHLWTSLSAVALRRASYLLLDQLLETEATVHSEALTAGTVAALARVQRREAAYREGILPSLLRASETAAFRELQSEVAAAERALSGPVAVDDVLLGPGQALEAYVAGDDPQPYTADFGDGSAAASGTTFSHSYSEPGIYPVTMTGLFQNEPVEVLTRVVQTLEKHTTGLSGHVVEPAGADLIDVAFPALTVGKLAPGEWVLGYSAEDSGAVTPDRWVALTCEEAVETLTCSSSKVIVPAVNGFSGGGWLGSLEMLDVVVTVNWNDGNLTIAGEVIIQTLVVLAKRIFGFEEQVAVDTIAGVLGVDPLDMPPKIPFLGTYDIQP